MRKMYTVQDIAESLQVHEETVRRWIRVGTLKATLIGSNKTGYRIARKDYDAMIEEFERDTNTLLGKRRNEKQERDE